MQPKRFFIECPQPVNDGQWHTAYIKRRANLVEAYFDDCTHKSGLFANISVYYVYSASQKNEDDKALIKHLHLFEGYGSQGLLAEFSMKNWMKGRLDALLKKLKETGCSD